METSDWVTGAFPVNMLFCVILAVPCDVRLLRSILACVM